MALNFPDSPTIGQVYTDTTSGFSYEWNGTVWISFSAASSSQIKVVDDISASFNSSTQIFALTLSGNPITPPSSQSLRVVLGGVVQAPGTDYVAASSNIVFTTAPTSGLSCSIVSLGPAVPVNAPNSGNIFTRQEYNPTGIQTSFTFTSTYTPGYFEVYRNGVKLVDGNDYTATDGSIFNLVTPAQNGDVVEALTYIQTSLYTLGVFANDFTVLNNATVAGITTLGGVVQVGGGSTALLVNGDARVTGILTVGTSSLTLNGNTNQITIGTGVTLTSPSTNQFSVATNGVQRIEIQSDGDIDIDGGGVFYDATNNRLAIGTTSPGAVTEINTASGGSVLLRLRDTPNDQTFSFDIDANKALFLRGGSSASAFAFVSGSSGERARIDSSGRLLVGTSTGATGSLTQIYQDNNLTSTTVNVSTAGGLCVISPSGANDYGAGVWFDHGSLKSGIAGSRVNTVNWGTDLRFYTHPDSTASQHDIIERMRITSSGNLLVGTTAAGGRLAVASDAATVSPIATTSVSGDLAYQAILVTKFDNDTTTSQNFIQFQVNNGGANCGRITANGANTAAFGSTSDIRLKENIEDLPPQLQNILSLRPVEFDYIESEGGGHQIGFIAQEMRAVYPDVVNERGEDDMLMITGWSKTEARLVKALQEAVVKIETLEARLTAAGIE